MELNNRFRWGRLIGSELRIIFSRRRTLLLLALLAVVPIMLAAVLSLVNSSPYANQGPGFIGQVTENGLFLVVVSLFLCIPFLLPFMVSIAAGDAIAGEAGTGTLRYLLLVPVGRGRLLLAKGLGALALVLASVGVVAVVAFVFGGIMFGFTDLTLISGQTISTGAGILRIGGISLYVAVSLLGLLAVGMFFSTMTEVSIGAMAATLVLWFVANMLDSLPQLEAIHPYLLSHYTMDFAEFLRFEPSWAALWPGIAVQLGWILVFGSLAWARFRSADVSS